MKIIEAIKNEILKWEGVSVGIGDFGSITFLYRGKEFGHIHKNGDLDIEFGSQLSAELLQHKLVQKHLYVPETSITYSVSNEGRISFAVSLLRFSFLIHLKKANENDTAFKSIFKSEMAKLPESLSSIFFQNEGN